MGNGHLQPEHPRCHNTPMKYEAGESDDVGNYEEWFICVHCGGVKDMDGKKVKQF